MTDGPFERRGGDGDVQLVYFDRSTQFSFVAYLTDESMDVIVQVEHGGYAEPVVDEFVIGWLGLAPLPLAAIEFKDRCRRYIAEIEMAS